MLNKNNHNVTQIPSQDNTGILQSQGQLPLIELCEPVPTQFQIQWRDTTMAQAAALRPIEWVLEGLIKSGEQTIIAGAPKAGKSRLAMQLGVALALGGQWLGFRAARPMKVLYFNFEMGEHSFSRAYLSMLGPNINKIGNRWLHTSDLKTIDVLDHECRAELIKIIKAQQPDFIVWDVLARMHNADEQSHVMKNVLLNIRVISGHAAHVVVHHTRKQSQDNHGPQQASDIRGSGAILGEVDNALVLSRRPGNGASHSLNFTCRDVSSPEDMLLGMHTDGAGFVVATEEEADKLQQVLQSCFNKYRQGNKVAVADAKFHIGSAYNIDPEGSQTNAYLQRAKNNNWIKNQRVGKQHFYVMTDDAPFLRVVSGIDTDPGTIAVA